MNYFIKSVDEVEAEVQMTKVIPIFAKNKVNNNFTKSSKKWKISQLH